jgi:hypothetical protein
MRFLLLMAFGLLAVVNCPAQFAPLPPPVQAPPPVTNTVNYAIHIQWKTAKAETNTLMVLTTEGQFSLDSVQAKKVKINNNEIPVTLRLSGTLELLNPDKGRLSLFLGRNVPYVTSVNVGGGTSTSSYQQMQVGLKSTYIVTFGKPLMIQSDDNEEVTVLVTRQED